ncbi:MAG: hypothetical protein KAI24_08080 [Planctomycetes bacterium]|nr:hypothetical protein [Planctomycetota bacterium]
MIKHLLSGLLALAFVAACSSEPVTDKDAGAGTAKTDGANDSDRSPTPTASTEPTGKLTLTYFNIDG